MSTRHFNPFWPHHTKESVAQRRDGAVYLSDEWWQLRAWQWHERFDEWPRYLKDDGTIDRGILAKWVGREFPNQATLLYNPNPPSIPLALRLDILYEQEGRCASCGVEEWSLRRRLEAHRLNPGHNGGGYVKGNVVLLCPVCHRSAPEHRQ